MKIYAAIIANNEWLMQHLLRENDVDFSFINTNTRAHIATKIEDLMFGPVRARCVAYVVWRSCVRTIYTGVS